MVVFSGFNTIELTDKVCEHLGIRRGVIRTKKFSDGERYVEISDDVCSKDVFVLQSVCPPTNDSLMELALLVDALKRSMAKTVSIIAPYVGYSRQDRCPGLKTSLSLKVVAGIVEATGADRLLVVDLHSEQSLGFFGLTTEQLTASPVFAEEILRSICKGPLVVVSPDYGGTARAKRLAQKLGCCAVTAGKTRTSDNTPKFLGIDGQVKAATCVVLDDLIDTGASLLKVVKELKEAGACKVSVFATHPVVSNVPQVIELARCCDGLTVADTISLPESLRNHVKVVTVAGVLAEAIRRVTVPS